MISADVQLTEFACKSIHVPRAGTFEVSYQNRLKHSDVRESADLENEEGRKSGTTYSYACSKMIFHYHSLISTALNLNDDWSHVSTTYAKALKNRIDFCMQIVFYRLSPLN